MSEVWLIVGVQWILVEWIDEEANTHPLNHKRTANQHLSIYSVLSAKKAGGVLYSEVAVPAPWRYSLARITLYYEGFYMELSKQSLQCTRKTKGGKITEAFLKNDNKKGLWPTTCQGLLWWHNKTMMDSHSVDQEAKSGLLSKFYWNTAMFILCNIYSCFCATMAEFSSYDRLWPRKPKIFTNWLLWAELCPPKFLCWSPNPQ